MANNKTEINGQQTDEEFEEESDYADSIVDLNLDELSRRVDEVFRTFDQRGNNTIDANELGNLMRCLQLNVTQKIIREVESKSPKDDNHCISIDHLKPILISYLQESSLKAVHEKRLEAAFRTIEEGHEPLTKDRLQQCLTSHAERLNPSEFGEMLNHLSVKKDGTVDWSSYVRDMTYVIHKKK